MSTNEEVVSLQELDPVTDSQRGETTLLHGPSGVGKTCIARKKDDLLDTLDALEQMSPKYKMLSEKVQEIAVRWNDNSLTSEEALERLRELEAEVEQAEQELAGSTREERARAAINALLDEEYGDTLSADESAEAVAELVLSVYQQTEEQMRGAFEEKLRERHIRNLRTALAKDDPAPKEMGLAMSDEFLEDAVYYLDETIQKTGSNCSIG